MKRLLLSCLLLGLFLPVTRAATDPGLREDGVIYLEDDFPDAIIATLKAPAVVYTQRNFQMALAQLYPGQTMEIVGFGPDGYIVKSKARGNTVEGWIKPENLPTGFDSSIFAKAKAAEAHRAAIAVAITNKTVIPGMTPDEVRQVLGRPTETKSLTDAKGSSVAWIYTTYRQEPQYNYAFDTLGRPVLQTYYVNVPVGRRIINFAGGVVSSVEDSATDPSSPGVVTN